MPIYEYYCPVCHGRFRHLARKIDAPAPACPRCDNADVERMVTAANVIHNEAHHRKELETAKPQVDQDDPEAIARFLQASGRLEDAEGVYDSPEYKELIYRRAQGATDEDLSDLVDGLAEQMQASEATKMAGAMLFSKEVENRMGAEGPPEDHEHEHEHDSRSLNTADDLGWG